jgi:predicted HAD superfamily Cof-like phosphohydrolase
LRLDLINEEVQELTDGLGKKSMLEIADALTDILYVVYGAGHACGIDLDECFNEVHRSNMTKLGEDGRPIYREDGKVMKGPNYSEPDLTQFVI